MLGALIIVLLVMTVPQLRVRVDPVLERGGELMSEALHGPLAPLMNPYRRLKTESAVAEVVRGLVQDRNMGYLRPRPDDFTAYMQRKVEGEDGLDAWGTPFILIPSRDSVSVVSAGPDREYDTEDDIRDKIRYRDPDYLGPRR